MEKAGSQLVKVLLMSSLLLCPQHVVLVRSYTGLPPDNYDMIQFPRTPRKPISTQLHPPQSNTKAQLLTWRAALHKKKRARTEGVLDKSAY